MTGLLVLASAIVLAMSGAADPSDDAAEPASLAATPVCDPIPDGATRRKAFRTADGFGRFAQGGRGGAVYAVTNLNDAGPGSLRACAEASGARTCVFRVSGTIAVDGWIRILKPYLTIAGQTSPGGIAIRVRNSLNAPILVQTHDVVIRHIRVRPGPSQIPSDNVDTIQISAGAHDVILDHISSSWPTDEGINIVGYGEKPIPCGETRDITVQWSILSEGLDRSNRGAHSRGSYFGYGAREVTFHHNLIASNIRRNPLLNTRGQFDMVNNVIYNSGRYNGEFYTRFGDLAVNVIGNVARLGPSSEKTTQLYLVNYFRDYPAAFAIYLKNNIDLHRPTNRGDELLVLEPRDRKYATSAPVGPLSLEAATITGPGQAYRDILQSVGATKPSRDAVDRRVLGDMAACRGAIIDDPRQVGGWPVLSGLSAPVDRDQDGMADDWEVRHGLSPANPDDRNGLAPDGDTFLNHYLGALAGDDTRQPPAVGPDPDPTCGFPVVDAPPLPDVHLSASPSSVRPGGQVELRWTGENIRSCKLAGRGVGGNGTLLVFPTKTTTYEIDCIGKAGGETIDSVVVKVR
jgi:pectate lyase